MKQRILQQLAAAEEEKSEAEDKVKILQENKAKQTIESKFFLRQDIVPRIHAFLQFHVLMTSPNFLLVAVPASSSSSAFIISRRSLDQSTT
jgi:hypothetical protein